MFSRKFSNTIRKKKRLIISAIISLILILGIGYASFYSDFSITGSLTVSGHYEPTLYNVLRQEATFGTVARKYTGAHADSMDPSKSTKDIYHWYSTNQQEGFQIIQKNNVIFANHCWKMIRTTDTGGVKLLYNGEAEDDKCLTSRGQHLGYTSSTTLTLSDNYWYGTDYTYDKNNRNYTLSGTTEQAYWDNNTAPNLIGKYTCQRLNLSDTCTSLFYITDVYDNTQARAIMFGDYLNYSTFGNIEYNTNGITPAYAGYMYNKTYERIENNLSQSATTLTSS